MKFRVTFPIVKTVEANSKGEINMMELMESIYDNIDNYFFASEIIVEKIE